MNKKERVENDRVTILLLQDNFFINLFEKLYWCSVPDMINLHVSEFKLVCVKSVGYVLYLHQHTIQLFSEVYILASFSLLINRYGCVRKPTVLPTLFLL